MKIGAMGHAHGAHGAPDLKDRPGLNPGKRPKPKPDGLKDRPGLVPDAPRPDVRDRPGLNPGKRPKPRPDGLKDRPGLNPGTTEKPEGLKLEPGLRPSRPEDVLERILDRERHRKHCGPHGGDPHIELLPGRPDGSVEMRPLPTLPGAHVEMRPLDRDAGAGYRLLAAT